MAKLYSKLGDSFDEEGQLTGYRSSGAPYSSSKHYNIRSFHSDQLVRTMTQLDKDFWENFAYQDISVGEPRDITGQGLVNRDMTSMNTFDMTELAGMTMFQLNYTSTATGNEEWSGSGITLARDSSYRYFNQLSVPLTAAQEKTINSYYEDDLITGLEGDYLIELTLIDFAGTGLDLANSFLDFSTDNGFTPGNTVSLAFNATLIGLSGVGAGTETKAVWERDSLNALDLTQIKAVRLRLKGGAGSFTFKTNALRVVPDSPPWDFPMYSVDTKRGILAKAPTRIGTFIDTAQAPRYFDNVKPLNSKTYVRFNTGHNPTGADNVIRLYARSQGVIANNYSVIAELACRDTQSRIHITDYTAAGSPVTSSTATTNILTANTDYFFVFTVTDGVAKAAVHAASGINLGAEVYSISDTSLARVERGYIGFDFAPYFQDFTLDHIQTQDATFGSFRTTPFSSTSFVKGVSLFTEQSPDASMLEDAGEAVNWGDATLTSLTTYDSITRTGAAYQGGIVYENAVMMGTGRLSYIRGKIWPEGTVNGTYRVALVDEYDSVSFVAEIPNLLPNRWNDFEITPHDQVFTVPLFLHVQQQGYHADTFRLSEVRIDHDVLAWEATADGTNWQSFLDTVNEPYGGIHFDKQGKALKLRATAYSDGAWISGYKLVPHYKT